MQTKHYNNSQNEQIKNKVAVVAGASKGIGASIAKYFAAEGVKVLVFSKQCRYLRFVNSDIQ